MLRFSFNWLKKFCEKYRGKTKCGFCIQITPLFAKARQGNLVQGSNSRSTFSCAFVENDSLAAFPATTGSADGRSVCCFAASAAFIRSKGGSEGHRSTATALTCDIDAVSLTPSTRWYGPAGSSRSSRTPLRAQVKVRSMVGSCEAWHCSVTFSPWFMSALEGASVILVASVWF